MKRFKGIGIHIGVALAIATLRVALADVGGRGAGTAVTGELIVLYADDFVHGRSELLHYVHDKQTGRVWQLKFEGEQPHDLRAGSVVKANGRAIGDELSVATGEIQTIQAAQVATVVTGDLRTAVMLVNLLDATVNCSSSTVAGIMFASTNSVDALYKEISYGNARFHGDVLGPYTAAWSSSDGCRYLNWAFAADQAAAFYGVDLSQYDRRVYVLPAAGGCAWTGLGTIGSLPARVWIRACGNPPTYAHELGHNFIMDHAGMDAGNDNSTFSEYGDASDFMGSGGMVHVNAPHKEQMGWTPPEKIITPETNVTIQLASLALNPSTTSYSQAVKIYRPSGGYYYYSYRRPIGYDANLSSTYTGGLSLHHFDINGGENIKTYFIKSMVDSEVFQDSTSGYIVQQVSHTSTSALVRVTASCQRAAPQTQTTPASFVQPGTTVTNIVYIKNEDCWTFGPTTFHLTPFVPYGWVGSLSTNSLFLQVGEKGSVTFVVTSPSGAADGSYTPSVSVTDLVNPAHDLSASVAYNVDTTPPSVPGGFTIREQFGVVYLNWTAAPDTSPITKYSIWRNCVKIADTQNLYYSETPGQGTWIYYVTATDHAGNVSSPTASASATTKNNVSPTVSVIASKPIAQESGPIAGAFTIVRTGSIKSSLNVSFTLSGTATGGTDYVTVISPVTISANSTCVEVPVTPIPNGLADGDKSLTLTLAASASYAIGNPGAATLTIKEKPFDNWRLNRFSAAELTNNTISGDSVDPDGDGIPNLLEYAFSLDPKIPNSTGLPVSKTQSDHLYLTYVRVKAAADIKYVVEVASQVTGPWFTGPAYVSEQMVGVVDATQTIQAMDMTPISSADKRFIRLRVERP